MSIETLGDLSDLSAKDRQQIEEIFGWSLAEEEKVRIATDLLGNFRNFAKVCPDGKPLTGKFAPSELPSTGFEAWVDQDEKTHWY